MLTLETPDLLIQKGRLEDWRDLYENVWSHPKTAKYMLWDITTDEEAAKARMERTLKWQAAHNDFDVFLKSTGRAIGWAGFQELSPGVYGETGIALGPAFVGRGYGKQILNVLTAHCFGALGAREFHACCRSQNAPSRAVILACGFSFDHTEPKIDPRDGSDYVMEYYVLKNPEL